MKNTLLALAAFSIIIAACDNKKPDSPELAEKINENKLDAAKEQAADMKKDAEFAVAAAEGGMLEVQLGELAQKNSTHPKIKEFGKMMVKDHGTANEELKSLATSKNITLPAMLGEEKQKDYDDLASKKGNEFDRAYADYMVNDHEEDIKAFKDEAENGNDADIKSWASGKISTLEHHLQMAKEAKDFVKK